MSELIVLDTHLWFWYINQEFSRFPRHWQERIQTTERLGVSPVSCFEIALAEQRGRLKLPLRPAEWFGEALTPAGIELLPLTPTIATRAVGLSPIHKDPFDRLIIATALEYGGKLASVDELFSRYAELSGTLLS